MATLIRSDHAGLRLLVMYDQTFALFLGLSWTMDYGGCVVRFHRLDILVVRVFSGLPPCVG